MKYEKLKKFLKIYAIVVISFVTVVTVIALIITLFQFKGVTKEASEDYYNTVYSKDLRRRAKNKCDKKRHNKRKFGKGIYLFQRRQDKRGFTKLHRLFERERKVQNGF